MFVCLKKSGLDQGTINVNGMEVSKMDFTCKMLFKEWKLEENEEEITVMRVRLIGENENGEKEEITYHLHDEFCTKTNTSLWQEQLAIPQQQLQTYF